MRPVCDPIGCVRLSSPSSALPEALTNLPDRAYARRGYEPSGEYGERSNAVRAANRFCKRLGKA